MAFGDPVNLVRVERQEVEDGRRSNGNQDQEADRRHEDPIAKNVEHVRFAAHGPVRFFLVRFRESRRRRFLQALFNEEQDHQRGNDVNRGG